MQNYITIKNNHIEEEIINKSRFITYLYQISSEDEAKTIINDIKKKHKDANHNCSAYTLGDAHQIQKANDDGEPSGTAGVPMLEALKKNDVHNTLAIVTRYFGGVKLGTGGLIRAYQGGVSNAIHSVGKVIIKNACVYHVTIQYELSGKFEHQIAAHPFVILDTIYTDKVTYVIQITEETKEDFEQFIIETTQATAEYKIHDELMLPFDL
ncbi:YigZ family protein [Macrococcoides caseolyticum]|uniref:YigZ family protein n=1 Tax=Macrococcoides caseolyticum TaxID=69966 RepID=UPI001F285F96|nr:YigZ family protein [Macrococcus caseolyticus]MCE4955852.1 YigZ family protein [Macrococcus caseolyticus]